MSVHDVRIEHLAPMRVACVRMVSASPETDALARLIGWADANGLMADPVCHPLYGYTFQQPKRGEREYGYEWWMKIDDAVVVGGGVTGQHFPGGLYAALTHPGPPGPDAWLHLWDWVKNSLYRWRSTHELEHPHNPLAVADDLVFDMYLPISEG